VAVASLALLSSWGRAKGRDPRVNPCANALIHHISAHGAAPPNNQVHPTRSAGEAERPLRVTWVFGGLPRRDRWRDNALS
jgi:hypothetical protein